MVERSGDRKDTYVPPNPENMKPKASRDNAVEMAAGGEHEREALDAQREKMSGSSSATSDPGRTDNPYGTGVGYAGEGSTAYGPQEEGMRTGDQDQKRTGQTEHGVSAPQRQSEQQHQQSPSGQKAGDGSGSQQSTGSRPPTQGTGSTPQSHTPGSNARPQHAQSGGPGGASAGTPATSQTATERGTVAEKGTVGGAQGQSATSAARDALGSVREQGTGSGTHSGATHAQPKADDVKQAATAKITDIRDQVQGAADDTKAQAQGKLDAVTTQAQDTLEGVKANLQSRTDQLKETVTGKTDQLKETVTGKTDQFKETVTGKTDQFKGTMSDKTDQWVGTVGERGEQVKQAANDKSTQAGEKLTGLAGTLREKTGTLEPDHPVATAATRAAGALEQTGSYLQEHTPDDWMTDLKHLIARKPLESVLVAAGLGYMVARAFKK